MRQDQACDGQGDEARDLRSELADKAATIGPAGRWSMPGHKGLAWPHLSGYDLGRDWTELPGLDDLHRPEAVLARLQERLAERWGAAAAWILGNGSTSGNLLMFLALFAEQGGTVLAHPAQHRSFYHALALSGATARFLPLQLWRGRPLSTLWGEGDAAAAVSDRSDSTYLQKNLADCFAKQSNDRLWALFITAPTYEGLYPSADSFRATCEAVHAAGGLVLVDCAHGAHFGLAAGWPEHPLALGADLVVQSLHKTLPMVNSAALLLMSPEAEGRWPGLQARLARAFDCLETSSPSYQLMAAAEGLAAYLAGAQAERDFAEALERMQALRHDLAEFGLSVLDAPEGYVLDPFKICILAEGAADFASEEGWKRAEAAGLLPEYWQSWGSLWMGGLGQPTDLLLRFWRELAAEQPASCVGMAPATITVENPRCLELSGEALKKALFARSESLPIEAAIGRILTEALEIYPPGIPLALPGEAVTPVLARQFPGRMVQVKI